MIIKDVQNYLDFLVNNYAENLTSWNSNSCWIKISF